MNSRSSSRLLLVLSVLVSRSFIRRLCVSVMKNNPVFIKDNLTCFIVSCQIWRPRSSSTTRPFLCAYGDFRVLLSDSESTTPFLYTSASCCCNGSFCNFFRYMANAFRNESDNTKPSEYQDSDRLLSTRGGRQAFLCWAIPQSAETGRVRR